MHFPVRRTDERQWAVMCMQLDSFKLFKKVAHCRSCWHKRHQTTQNHFLCCLHIGMSKNMKEFAHGWIYIFTCTYVDYVRFSPLNVLRFWRCYFRNTLQWVGICLSPTHNYKDNIKTPIAPIVDFHSKK